jgi:ribosomal-protein-alanine N-acetyltransferase
MDAPFRIRPTSAADGPRIAALEQAIFPDPWSAEGIAEVLRTPTCLGLAAEVGGVVVGYVLARRIADTAEVLNLAVEPDRRRAGLGGTLLDRAMAVLREAGAREVFLEVRVSNAAARRLYESRGFRVAGMRRAYYRRPTEDALVFRWADPGAA